MKMILLFGIPMFVGTFFQSFYNMVDSMVVGRFVGAQALAAVGASSGGYNLLNAVVTGFTAGASIIIAQLYGAQDTERLKTAYVTSFKLLLITGSIFTFVGIFLSGPILHLLGTPEDVYHDAWIYMEFMCVGILATCLYNGMAAYLRAVGNSTIPLVALIISSICNVVLDLLFVLQFNMGVSGVAIATVLSQLVSGIFCLIYVNKKLPYTKFTAREFLIDKEIGKEMIRLGLPSTFSSAVVTASVMFVQAAVNSYGSTVMAAYTTDIKVETVIMGLGFSIGMATGVFCGQNQGAKLEDRVNKGLFAGIKITLVYHIAMGTVSWVFARFFAGLFTTDMEVINIAVPIIRITACFAPVLGTLFIFQNFLRSVSDVKPTILMSCAEIFSRGVLPFVLSAALGYFGIWWATPIGWCLSLSIGIIRYKSGKWKYQADKLTATAD